MDVMVVDRHEEVQDFQNSSETKVLFPLKRGLIFG